VTTRACPHNECQNELPPETSELSDVSIAVIGAKESGKSNFIALLINRISLLAMEFDWTLSWLTEGTNTRYKEKFYNPLFLGKVPVQETQEQDDDVRAPLLYSLNIRRKKKITIAFFDTAGESLDKKEDELANFAPYIYNSSGIICLIDPLQLDLVQEELLSPRCGKKKEDLPSKNTDGDEILNRINRVIRNGYRDKRGKPIPMKDRVPIPLAVAFSKIDMLERPSGNDSLLLLDQDPLFGQSAHRGHYDKAEGNSISESLRHWLQVADTKGIVNQATGFTHHQFFGFSALGCNPQATQKLQHRPKPWRVEDPFLWILWCNGLIPPWKKSWRK